MRHVTRVVAAGILAAGMLLGAAGGPAQGANLLCPQLCLTGGLLSGVGFTSVGVQESEDVTPGETRAYNFAWTAIDVTEQLPEVVALTVKITANGSTSNGVFQGSGTAKLRSPYYTIAVGVSVTDVGGVMTASGGGLLLTFAGVVGAAEYTANHDYDWDYDIT